MKKILLSVGLILVMCGSVFGQYQHTEQEVEAKYEECVLKSVAANEAWDHYNGQTYSYHKWLVDRCWWEKDDLAESEYAVNEVYLNIVVEQVDIAEPDITSVSLRHDQIVEDKQNALAADIAAGLAKNNHNWDVAYDEYEAAIALYSSVITRINASNTEINEANSRLTSFYNEVLSVIQSKESAADCEYQSTEQWKFEADGNLSELQSLYTTTVNRMGAYHTIYGADEFYLELVELANAAGVRHSLGDTRYDEGSVAMTAANIFMGSGQTSVSIERNMNAYDDFHLAGQKYILAASKYEAAKVHYSVAINVLTELNDRIDQFNQNQM